MVVKTNTAPDSKTEAAPGAIPPVYLELATYQRYHRSNHLYVAEEIYKFTRAQADVLLKEVDDVSGACIWRHPLVKKTRQEVEEQQGRKVVVDATTDVIKEDTTAEKETSNRMDIGSDDEIADILAAADAGEVTTV